MRNIFIYIPILLSIFSCGNEFLDAKPDKALVIPKTLADYQAILDDANQQINQSPGLIECAIDDYLALDNGLNSVAENVRHAYLWDREGLSSLESHYDWDILYAQVLRSNLVLEGLQGLVPDKEESRYNDIKGAAHFFRAWHFFNLLQVYSPPYDPITAGSDLGIVLKLSADVNEKQGLTNVEGCYIQILDDLKNAISLLPKASLVPSRPNLVAAYALFARVYLSRFDYENAAKYAQLALEINDALLDFNSIGANFPDPLFDRNPEVIFHSMPILQASSLIRNAIIDPDLVKLYADGDLRKSKFLKLNAVGQSQINRTYLGSTVAPYAGLTTSEMYLVLAECLVHLDKKEQAMDMLNTLRKTRFDKKTTYTNLISNNKEEAMDLVHKERRQELIFRGLRWYDLRRLNKNSMTAKKLERVYNGLTYILKADDKFYGFPIPKNELLYIGKVR